MLTQKPYTFDRVIRIIITLLFICGGLWLINYLSGVLLPFCIACLIAYILEPLVQLNHKIFRIKRRFIAVFSTLIESLCILIVLCWIFVPIIANEAHQVAIMFKQYANANANIQYLPESLHSYLRELIDFDKLSTLITRQNIESLFKIASSFLSSGVDLIIGVFGWFFVILYVIFIMLDYEKLILGFKRMIPSQYRNTILNLGHDVKTSMNLYFRGQSLVALCVGILFSIGFLIIDLPMAIMFGMFIGLLNMVPYLQLISLLPAALLCIVCSVNTGCEFWVISGECLAVYCIVQVIQDGFIVPKVMGKTMGLNPAIILLSLSIWGALLGFIGLIIALPLTSLLLSYYNRYVLNKTPFSSHDTLEKQNEANKSA